MDTEKLQYLLNAHIMSPDDPKSAYELAEEYRVLGASAAAVSYYMVALENTDNPVLKYECLLAMGHEFLKQGDRLSEVRLFADYARSVDPTDRRAYAVKCMALEEQAKPFDRTREPGLYLECWLKLANEALTAINLPCKNNQKYEDWFTDDCVFRVWYAEALLHMGIREDAEGILNGVVYDSADGGNIRLKAMRLLYRNGLKINLLEDTGIQG